MLEIKFDSLSFHYGKKEIFREYSISFSGPGLYLITGPSGCGKTTLFRLIAGLEKPTSGSLHVSAPVSVSFQEYRLFPTVSALTNVLCVRHPDTKSESDADRTEALVLLESLGLSPDVSFQSPSELSGGMKQRVSLARALFSLHPIKLLDEVTKELDPAARKSALDRIVRSSESSLILLTTHRPEDLDGLPCTRVSLPQLL